MHKNKIKKSGKLLLLSILLGGAAIIVFMWLSYLERAYVAVGPGLDPRGLVGLLGFILSGWSVICIGLSYYKFIQGIESSGFRKILMILGGIICWAIIAQVFINIHVIDNIFPEDLNFLIVIFIGTLFIGGFLFFTMGISKKSD